MLRNVVLEFGSLDLKGAFTNSSIPIYRNFVKQIIFRAGALLLQFFIFKICSLLAWSVKSFISVLMFSEDPLQRAIFVKSRGFAKSSFIVLLLTILMFVGGFFDTLLWAMDSPGYISQKRNVTAAVLADRLLPQPAYLIISDSQPGEVAALDAQLGTIIGANLFQPGVNFSLTGEFQRGTPKIAPRTQSFAEVGPRIWLDDEGFSVSADTYITTSGSGNESFSCPWKTISAETQLWNCTFDNAYAMQIVDNNDLGQPEIHWDDASDKKLLTQYLTATREDNPWHSLGIGGDTALMKQMFTLTKGNTRHTFVETAYKIAMVTDYSTPFRRDEMSDLVKRSWSSNPADWSSPIVQLLIDSLMNAAESGKSGVYGLTAETPDSVAQINYEILNPESRPGKIAYMLFRNSVVNITLVRSDELPAPVTPLEPCPGRYYSNIALGGRVRETDCYKSMLTSNTTQPDARFHGQVDTSAFLILNGILGDGRTNRSAAALNTDANAWLDANSERINNLLLSRGAILGLAPDQVSLEITTLEPAVSPLQLLLVGLVAGLAALSWLALLVLADAHYASSLWANLIATAFWARVDGEERSRKPGYVQTVPDVKLEKEHGGVVMAMGDGVFRHVLQDDGQGVRKRLIGPDDGSDAEMGKKVEVKEYEVPEGRSEEKVSEAGLKQDEIRGGGR